MPGVFYRSPAHAYPLAVRGEGIYLYDADGRQYLDGSGGAAISCLGHGHPRVIEAVRRQAGELAFAHTWFFTNQPQETLAGRLAQRFPEAGARVYFLSGGSEANEAAIKLARRYWLARGETGKHLVISRRQSYHGNTLGALSVTGHLERRGPYEPLLHDWPRIAPCFAFRHRHPGESMADYAERAALELEAAILAAGPERVSAFIAETVVGAALGAAPAQAGYFARIREICDRHGVLLIMDEVMAGGGRTGSYYAFEQEGVVPDIVTLAKGVGGGYQPLAAMLARAEVHDRVAAAGGFPHGHTYVGHATACAAGNAVLDAIEQDDLLTTVQARGERLQSLLHERFGDHPHVGDIRGRGLMWGLELVLDRASNEPVPARLGLPSRIRETALQAGLICYPGGGSAADGRNGAHIMLAPPYIITEAELEELCARLGRALEAVDFG